MRVKGSALRSSMNFLRENFPPETALRILNGLPDEDRKVLGGTILMSDWYRAEILFGLMHAMTGETSEKPEDLFIRLGRQSCEDGLNTIYKIFFKVGTTSFILKHVAQVWNNYYDEGKMLLLDSTPMTAHLRLEGAHLPDAAMCIRVSGWMMRAVELSGGKNVRIDHASCAHRKDPDCEWKARWE